MVENIVVYPPEFSVLWTKFEPWTIKDSVAIPNLMIVLLGKDWFAELLRERLLEVYDKSLVDELIPYRKEGFQSWQYDLMETVSDAELERID